MPDQSIELNDADEAMLAGADGPAAQFALELICQFSAALGAPRLLDIEAAHIDSCLYTGQVSLDFARRLRDLNARYRVPTTLNVGAIDLIHPELFQGSREEASAGREQMELYQSFGAVPTFTCAPYQTIFRPQFGAQIAWAESNAIVFANSVIGARSNRYGDFIDACCAVTGRAPAYGLHLTENRRARMLFEVEPVAAETMDPGLLAVAVGLMVGRLTSDRVPCIDGLPHTLTEDDLKALGAASASAGAVGLFHAVGLTPEAATRDDACQGQQADEIVALKKAELQAALARLSSVPDGTPIAAVALGTPHFSLAEFTGLHALLATGAPACVPIYVNTNRHTFEALEARGWDRELTDAGVVLVIDTCTYVTAIIRELDGAIMTNSGKWAYYAPGNLGVDVAFAHLKDCVASARAGRLIRSGAL